MFRIRMKFCKDVLVGATSEKIVRRLRSFAKKSLNKNDPHNFSLELTIASCFSKCQNRLVPLVTNQPNSLPVVCIPKTC